MIKTSRVTWNEYNEPKVTITIEGPYDIYRFAHNMTSQQCEIADQGRKILRALKRKWGKERYHAGQVSLHGKVVHQ